MKELLEISKNERAQFFTEAAARSDKIKNPIIIEKDFWVCWTLERIFSSKLAPHVIFKGGTSLSKCYNIIERFSEDIDLTLSKKYIGITDDNDPATITGRKQRDKRSTQLTKLFEEKIYNEVQPLLEQEFKNNLSNYFVDSEWELKPEQDENNNLSLIFSYPNSLAKEVGNYIQSVVKLEFGARCDISPSEQKTITPYVKQIIPSAITSKMEINITSLLAKRTYWEKATLLHAEYHRDTSTPIKSRMFRHYYDLVMLDQNGLTNKAIQDIDLLKDVVKNKSIYFTSKKANYETAEIGTLRLYPNEIFIGQLRQDYKKMTEMFFGDIPDFDSILFRIKQIEISINNTP